MYINSVFLEGCRVSVFKWEWLELSSLPFHPHFSRSSCSLLCPIIRACAVFLRCPEKEKRERKDNWTRWWNLSVLYSSSSQFYKFIHQTSLQRFLHFLLWKKNKRSPHFLWFLSWSFVLSWGILFKGVSSSQIHQMTEATQALDTISINSIS